MTDFDSVVFVHGLFGHPFTTWSAHKRSPKLPQPSIQTESVLSLPVFRQSDLSKRKEDSLSQQPEISEEDSDKDQISTAEYNPWPEKLLPDVIPSTRILTWGYDADVNGFFSSASQNHIYQHANNLLSDLTDLRSSSRDEEVPIIFVAHSLGGIVVKAALNQSSSVVDTQLKKIAQVTYGVIFLGTPHRGSSSASFGSLAHGLSRVALRRPNLKIIRALEKNSDVLDAIGSEFSQTMLKHKIRLRSFREEKATTVLGLVNIMVRLPFGSVRVPNTMKVVEPDSAKIGDRNEELGSIPSNHSNMTKFQNSNDIGFKRVSSHLRRWVKEIEALGGT